MSMLKIFTSFAWLNVCFALVVPPCCYQCQSFAQAPAVASSSQPAARQSYAQRVGLAEERIVQDLNYLASDELEGRGAGTDGIQAAAEYIRQSFLDAGFQIPAEDDDGFLEVDVPLQAALGSENRLTAEVNDHTREFEIGEEVVTCSFGSSGAFSADVVFCGYAISAPNKGYDDFRDLDLKGKVALFMRRVPNQAKKSSKFVDANGGIDVGHAGLTTKVRNVAKRGAVAAIMVNDPFTVEKNLSVLEKELEQANSVEARQKLKEELESTSYDDLVDFGYGGGSRKDFVPTFHMKAHVADELLETALGKTLQQLEAEINEAEAPRSVALPGLKLSGRTEIIQKTTTVRNVIAILPGRGNLADEYVIVGAHYDHLGRGGRGSLSPRSTDIHNGADDNASGTSALIEVARQITASPAPRNMRSIVLIAFAGEELGLLGSKDYVKEPLFALEDTIAMLNLDMVGRISDSQLTVFGVQTSPKWEPLLDRLAEQQELTLNKKSPGRGPSDHSSFYDKQIPVLHLFSGLHKDYHRPTDDPEQTNTQGIARSAILLSDIVRETATNPARPGYLKTNGSANPFSAMGIRPTFGAIPDLNQKDTEGFTLKGVATDSAAMQMRFQAGDVIQQFGNRKIGDHRDFLDALGQYRKRVTVPVLFKRDGELYEFKVKLGPPR